MQEPLKAMQISGITPNFGATPDGEQALVQVAVMGSVEGVQSSGPAWIAVPYKLLPGLLSRLMDAGHKAEGKRLQRPGYAGTVDGLVMALSSVTPAADSKKPGWHVLQLRASNEKGAEIVFPVAVDRTRLENLKLLIETLLAEPEPKPAPTLRVV